MSYLSYSQFLKRSLLMPGKQLHLKYNGHLWILLFYFKQLLYFFKFEELQKFGRFRSGMFVPDLNKNALIYKTRLNYHKNCLWGNLWCLCFCLAGKITIRVCRVQVQHFCLDGREEIDRELRCPELVFISYFVSVFPIKLSFVYSPMIKPSTKPRHFKG